MILRSTTCFVLSFFCSLSLTAQEQPPEGVSGEQESLPVRVGLGFGGTMNLHRGDFTSYDGILECGTFDEATTIGWNAGYLFEFPLSASFAITPRLYYWKPDGDFTTPNPIPARIAIDDETVVPLETEHTLRPACDNDTEPAGRRAARDPPGRRGT